MGSFWPVFRLAYTAETAPPLPPQQTPQIAEPKSPTFAETILDIFTRQAQGRPITNDDSKLFSFLAQNGIEDYEGLEQHLKNLMSEQRTLSHEYTPIRERLAELSEHMSQYEDYKKWRTEHQQYKKDLAAQKPWRKKSFAADNNYIIDRFNETKRYIDGVRNEQGKIPLASWQKEYSDLSANLRALDGKYQVVKEKVARVGKFRVRVYDALWNEQQRGLPIKRRSHSIDL